jgi:predicted DNA-binding protein
MISQAKQFPIRLGDELNEEFERISKETLVDKSNLIRLAVKNLIHNVDTIGIQETIKISKATV